MIRHPLSQEDLLKSRTRLLAGRIKATQLAPYFATALFALVPVERVGFGTFAVDKRWRMYYDPQCCLDWSIEELAATWLHEVGHVVRSHAKRYEAMNEGMKNAHLWNASADASINSDLRDIGILLPDPERRYYAEPNAEFPDWKRGMTTEELYRKASGHANQDLPKGGKDSEDSSKSDQEDSQQDDAQEQENSPSDDSESSPDTESGQEGEDASEAPETGEAGDDSSPADEDSQDSAGNSSDESDSEASEGDTSADEDTTGGSGAQDGEPDSSDTERDGSQAHDCGSGATGGQPREYEEADNDDGSVDEGKAEQIRKEVAEEIIAHNERYGNVPGGWLREAEEILDPKVDWRKEINAVVRRVSIMVAGKRDYTYSRPSRRSVGSPFFFPSLRQPRPPEIAIVLDTSGSMTPKELAECLSEISDIIRRTSRATSEGVVRVINCDAGATEVQQVKDIANFEIVGGGGTDMRVGIKAASELTPKPDLVITMTDGGTPWPRKIPVAAPRARYVALLVGKNAANYSRRTKEMQIPEWMYTIAIT